MYCLSESRANLLWKAVYIMTDGFGNWCGFGEESVNHEKLFSIFSDTFAMDRHNTDFRI